MSQAVDEARFSGLENEVPVGAIVVLNEKIIGRGHNQCVRDSDPTAHAEIVAIRNACKAVNNYRLSNATLYVTLEPCVMCAGALVAARVSRVVFGAYDYKTGAAGSTCNLLESPMLNHQCTLVGGVSHDTCGDLLRKFFEQKR
jgi:tRNA(adenine34) deaminase